MHLSVVVCFFGRSERFCRIVGLEASESRNLNCFQSTTTRWAVSNERQQGGVEKKTPIDPMPMGVQTGGTNKAVTLLTHGLTNANPMPRKRKTPSARASNQWGKTL